MCECVSRRTLATLALAGLILVEAIGQQLSAPPAAERGPVVVPEVRHDLSPPLGSLANVSVSAPTTSVLRQIKEPGPMRVGRGPQGQRVDTIVQDVPSASSMPPALFAFEGIGNVNGVLPPDTNGDVGPNHYVQWVNLSFAIWSKGSATTPPALLYGPAPGSALWQGFGGPCESTNNGDPIVMYDHLADRWFMSQLALPNLIFGFVFGPFYQCIAVSATPDPMGPYHRYQFVFNKLNDYSKFGLWPDAYYMAINQYQSGTLAYAGQGVVAFDRARMLNGEPASMVYFDLASVDMTLGGMLPSHLAGPAPPVGSPNYFAQVDDDSWGYSPDQVQLWQFHVDWAQTAASSFTRVAAVPVAPFDSDLCGYAENCIPQPGTTVKVASISDRLMYRLEYHNFGDHESLVVNHTVDVDGNDHAGIRWYEIRSPGSAPTIHQQGTYAPDMNHRWMGSTAMDRFGNIAMAYSVASDSTSPSIRYTGRLADDPPGEMTQGEADIVVGSGSQTHSSGRWGDYSLLAVDPLDQCTFWYTQEYYAATSEAGWQTRVGSFAFPSCEEPTSDLPRVTIVATTTPAREAGLVKGTFTVTRTGDLTAPMDVAYGISGSAVAGVDYVPLTNSVTIAAGSATATIDVTPIDDLFVEQNESVVLTLGSNAAYVIGVPGTAIVSIVSDDLPPDLIVAAVTAPAVGGAGAQLSVNETTKNQGGGWSEPSVTAFYLSVNSAFNPTDIPLETRNVPTLAPGDISAGMTTLTIPPNTAPGTYFIVAKADGESALVETLETNNTKASGAVRIGPDLAVTSLVVPAVAGDGETIDVSDTTSNNGGGDAGASRTALYLSTNATWDALDKPIGFRDIGSLGAGAVSSATTHAVIPPGTAGGIYYVIARADDQNGVLETQEANNVRTGQIKIGPDLVVSNMSVAAPAGAGGTATVTDTIKNQGTGSPAAPSTTAFYLSPNTLFDATDKFIGSQAVGALGPGQTQVMSSLVQIPADTATGSYFVVARADANGQIAESVETNNGAFAPIKIGPDLTESALSVAGTLTAGGAINVTDTAKNAGGGAAGASTTRFYLSSNGGFDANDQFICSRDVPALGPGDISLATTPCTIPAGTAPGSMFLIGVVDGLSAVTETSETNNTRAISIRIN